MNLLKEGYNKQNDRLISKAVLLLMHFFDSFEGKSKLEAGETSYKGRYSIKMTVQVTLKPDNILKPITVNSTQTIGFLRNLIAENFELAINEFKVYSKGSLLETDEDDTPLYNFQFGGSYMIYKVYTSKDEDKGFHPKNIMTQNVECIDLLFSLLSEDVQGNSPIFLAKY